MNRTSDWEGKRENIRYTRRQFIDSDKCEVLELFTRKLKKRRDRANNAWHRVSFFLQYISNIREQTIVYIYMYMYCSLGGTL
jgi:hypothetical protein